MVTRLGFSRNLYHLCLWVVGFLVATAGRSICSTESAMAMRIDPTPFKEEDPLPLYREDQVLQIFLFILGELRSVVEATAEIIQAPIAMVARLW